jgi:replication factor C subunit 1
MEKLNMNKILKREDEANYIKNYLLNFDKNKSNTLFKKGLYVYGLPGSGKTTFVTNILKDLEYDIIRYDAGDGRNTNFIEDITNHNTSDKNVISLFNKKIRKIIIVMDEIDGMNNGDKGGINTLIKLIRTKKTKRQKLEETNMNPIICIGNYKVDKKIKELIKVCNTVELKTPDDHVINDIFNLLLPHIEPHIKAKLITFIKGDLRKFNNIYLTYNKNPHLFTTELIENVFQIKTYNDDTKKIANHLINNYHSFREHNNIMNETDRTSIGLLWHENIIDTLEKIDKKIAIPFYIKQLDNICFADYIDRITFQKQIWQFNEMTSLIKTFKNNKHYHEEIKLKNTFDKFRFTKVLTKYSTEYNNSLFIQKICLKLGMDKKDLFGFIINNNTNTDFINQLENYEINKLDVNRMYRYIEKYIKENAIGTNEKEIELQDIEEGETEML